MNTAAYGFKTPTRLGADYLRYSYSSWLVLSAITSLAIVDSINATLGTFALPYMMGSTLTSPDEITWTNIAYFAAKLIGFLSTVWLLRYLGRRRIITFSAIALLVSSVACIHGNNVDYLVLMRIMQGVSGAMVLVAGQTVLFEIFPSSRQGVVQAVFALGVVLGPSAVAPTIEGFVTEWATWSDIFWIDLPLGLMALPILFRLLPEYHRPYANARLDWLGLALLASSMLLGVFVMTQGNRYNWFEEPTITSLTISSVGLFVAFVSWEILRISRTPLLTFSVFSSQSFTFGFIVSFIAGFAIYGSALLLANLAMNLLHLMPTDVGALLFPAASVIAFGLLTTGLIIDWLHVSPMKLIPFGILLFIFSMLKLSHVTAAASVASLLPALFIRGAGIGILFVALTVFTFHRLRGSNLSQGISLFSFGRQAGGLIGAALLSRYLAVRNAVHWDALAGDITMRHAAFVAYTDTVVSKLLYGYQTSANSLSIVGAIVAQKTHLQAEACSLRDSFLAVICVLLMVIPLLIAIKLLQKSNTNMDVSVG